MVIVFSTDEIPVVMSGRGCGVSGVGQLLDWETHVNTPCSTGPFIMVMRLGFMFTPVEVFSQPSLCMRVCAPVCQVCWVCGFSLSISHSLSSLLFMLIVFS